MPLNAIHVSVTGSDLASFVSDVLFEMGALSVSTSDLYAGTPKENPIFIQPVDPSEITTVEFTPWQNAKITALYPLSFDPEQIIMSIATHFQLSSTPTFSITSEQFDEKTPAEWISVVQENFQPIELGRVRISFPWHEPRNDLIDVRLKPGIAFGTGEHVSTQLCVSWLSRVVEPSQAVLDFGCGSGVLSITAVMLAKDVSAVGVDIDHTSVGVALQNAQLNNVENIAQFFHNDDEPFGCTYDVVVANILAQPLKRLAKHLASRMKPGGLIGLAGLLASQGPDIIECYAKHGVALKDARVENEWLLLVGVKS